MSDVYVYEDCYGGWTTMVAGNRLAFRPLPSWPYRLYPDFGQKLRHGGGGVIYPNRLRRILGTVCYFIIGKWDALHSWTLGKIPHRDIKLPHAGERFNDPTPEACAVRLTLLRKLGYNVPQYAIDALVEEAKDTP